KQELGYAVVDEVVWPRFKTLWIDPLEQTEDPIKEIKLLMQQIADEESHSDLILTQGCPLNNLAQEMSPLDEGFRQRLEKIYTWWRLAFKSAVTRGIKAGRVRKDVSPAKVAALLVAAFTGIMGNVKNAQDTHLLREAGEALIDYLETLRP